LVNRLLVWYGELATTRKLTARGLALMALPLAWIAVLLVVPLGAMIAWSVASRGAAGEIVWTLGWQNFTRLAGFDAFGWTKAYLSILGSTIVISTITTLISIALAYPLAFFIALRSPGRRYLWLALIIIPFCTNLVIRTYAWMLLLGNQMPPALIAQWLHLIEPSAALYPSTLALYIGMVSNSLPFAVLPLYTNVEKLDWALVEASRDLYSSPPRVFFHAIFPQTLPGLVTAVILTFIPAMGAFLIPDLLGGGKTWMLGNLIQHQFGVSRDFPFGAAVSLVLTFITMVGLLILRRSGDEVNIL
jgi:spermidine/putrescine transport system permease protein